MEIRKSDGAGEGFEGRDDDFFYEIDHLLSEWQERLTFDNTRFVERYIDGRLELLVHFVIDTVDHDWIARCQRARRERVVPKERDFVVCEEFGEGLVKHGRLYVASYVHAFCSSGDCHEQAVLVGNIQTTEDCKDVPFTSVIRLYSVEHLNRRRFPKTLYASRRSVWKYVGWFPDVTNREIEAVHARRINSLRPSETQGEPEVIERASQIVDDVSEYRRHGGINIEFPSQVIEALSCLHIVCVGKGISAGFTNGFDQRVKIIDVMIGPFNFRPHSTQRIATHD